MTDQKITMDREYHTFDGRPVRILCTDGPGELPVVGLVGISGEVCRWNAEGNSRYGSDYDLIPAPSKPRTKEVWVHWRANNRGIFLHDKPDPFNTDRARQRFVLVEGQFDDVTEASHD